MGNHQSMQNAINLLTDEWTMVQAAVDDGVLHPDASTAVEACLNLIKECL